MIILDTNVISEMVRPSPDVRVAKWLASEAMSVLFSTAITQAEVLYGLTLLPEGRRRSVLIAAIRPIFEEDLAGRILPFDAEAASTYAEVAAGRRLRGQPISQIDAQIAAIVRARGGVLATRNVRDFVDCGIDLIDPWNAG